MADFLIVVILDVPDPLSSMEHPKGVDPFDPLRVNPEQNRRIDKIDYRVYNHK